MSEADDEARVIAGLTEAQRHFIVMSSSRALHPYDIDVSGLTAKAMVRRGIAYRALCAMTSTRESFNGYGLTDFGLAVRRRILETRDPTPSR